MSTSTSLSTSAQKGFAPVLIVLIIAVLAAGAGFFVYTNYSNNQTKTAPIVQTKSTPAPQKTEVTNSASMANWKTYTTSEFTLQYPPDMVMNDSEKDFYRIHSTDTSVHGNLTTYNMVVAIDMRPSQRTLDYETVISNQKNKFYDARISSLKEKDAIIISGSIAPDDPLLDTTAYLRYKNSAVSITYGRYKGSPDRSDLFNQILSTFKFLP